MRIVKMHQPSTRSQELSSLSKGRVTGSNVSPDKPLQTRNEAHRTPVKISTRENDDMRLLPANSPQSTTYSPRRSITDSTQGNVSIDINSSFSDGIVCRICHCDGSVEPLLSPCYCSGSVGLLHLTCLQKWLGSSNKTICELCHFKFTLQRKSKPFYKFLQNPGTPKDKKYLLCDFVCGALLTPLTVATCYLCIRGSTFFEADQWEAIGLVGLALLLGFLYFLWIALCLKQNIKKWLSWRTFNKDVTLICKAPKDNTRTNVQTKQEASLQLQIQITPDNNTSVKQLVQPEDNRNHSDSSVVLKQGSHRTSRAEANKATKQPQGMLSHRVMTAADLPTVLRRETRLDLDKASKASITSNSPVLHKKRQRAANTHGKRKGCQHHNDATTRHKRSRQPISPELGTRYSTTLSESLKVHRDDSRSKKKLFSKPVTGSSKSSNEQSEMLCSTWSRPVENPPSVEIQDLSRWNKVCTKETYI